MELNDITITKKEAEELGIINGLGLVYKDIYKSINKQILDLINSNEDLPWRKPWRDGYKHKGVSYGPQNYVTGNPYRGANAFTMWLFNMMNNRQSIYFLTKKQIQERGGTLNKTAKPLLVWAFIKGTKIEKDKNGKEIKIEEQGIVNYYVYDLLDTENVKPIERKTIKNDEKHEVIANAELIIEHMPKRPKIDNNGGNSAFYSPAMDKISMPAKKAFKSTQEYYSTLFHELVHSTGHKTRLDRKFGESKGDKAYAFEELIAEIGAAYLCGVTNIDYYTLKNSAAYLKGWASKLKSEIATDKTFLFRAILSATKAAKYIVGTTLEKHGKIVIDSEKKEHYPGKEILPNKSVKASLTEAIKQLSSLPKFKNVGPMAISMFYNKFKNKKVDETAEINRGLENKIFEKLDNAGFVEFYARMHKEAVLTESGFEAIKSITARYETLKAKKSGTDLFPDLAGYQRVIPRDLFNESKLLKCIGKIVLNIEDGLLDLSYEWDENDFDIDLTEDNSLYIKNLIFYIGTTSNEFILSTTYNSKQNWPLKLNNPDYSIIIDEVLNEKGDFTTEFKDFIKEQNSNLSKKIKSKKNKKIINYFDQLLGTKITRQEYLKFISDYDKYTELYQDEENEVEKERLTKIIKDLELKIHSYERNYELNGLNDIGLQFIERFVNFHNKKVLENELEQFINDVNLAVKTKKLTKSHPYVSKINNICERVYKVYREMPSSTSSLILNIKDVNELTEILEKEKNGLGILPVVVAAAVGKGVEHLIHKGLSGYDVDGYYFDTIPKSKNGILTDESNLKQSIIEIREYLIKNKTKVRNDATGWFIEITNESIKKWFSKPLGFIKIKSFTAINEIIKIAVLLKTEKANKKINRREKIHHFWSIVNVDGKNYPFGFMVIEKEGKFIYNTTLIPVEKIIKPTGLAGFKFVENFPFIPKLKQSAINKRSTSKVKQKIKLAKSKPNASKPSLSGLLTTEQMAGIKYEELKLNPYYAKILGKPATNFDMCIHGEPGAGKTVFLLKLANNLAENFGKVVYITTEEFGSATLTKKINDFAINSKNLYFTDKISKVNPGDFQFVFIDSVNHSGLKLSEYQEIRKNAPKTAFILILQTTKGGDYKGGKDWPHEVEICARLFKNEKGLRMIEITKDRYSDLRTVKI